MIASKVLRTSLGLAAIAAATYAQAQISLLEVSAGNLTQTGTTIAENETVVAQSPLDGLTTYTATWDAATGLGTGTYSGGGNSINIDLSYVPGNLVFTSPSSQSIDGSWTYVSGTGSFANMAGGGTMGLTLLVTGSTTAFSGTSLSGTLNAVPEPNPSAVIGVGVLGLCLVRRRKR